MDSTLEVWMKQDGEKGKEYDKFTKYRDLGYARTQSAVAVLCECHVETVYRAAKRWNWDARVSAYDLHMEQFRLLERKQQIIDMEKRHVQMGRILSKKGLEGLQVAEGKKLTPAEALKFMELGIKVEREAIGRPGSITAHTNSDGGAVQVRFGSVNIEALTLTQQENLAVLLDAVLTAEDGPDDESGDADES